MADFLPKRDEDETIQEYARRCAGPLKEAQDYWARVLRLQDWDITVSVISKEKMHQEMEGDGFVGFCSHDRVQRMADIALLAAVATEHDFVHEMLHVVLDDMQARADNAVQLVESAKAREALDKELKESLERTINQLSKALIAARDGGKDG